MKRTFAPFLLPSLSMMWLSWLVLLQGCQVGEKTDQEWRVTGGSKENIRYSTLNQIDTANVSRLKAVWIFTSGDTDTVNYSQIQCNPIIVDGVLYATSPQLKLLALDAASGKQKWRFDPQADSAGIRKKRRFSLNNNRGVTYWKGDDEQRILYVAGSFLYAVDARSGSLIKSFGDYGSVDLHEGLGRDVRDLYVAATSPGIIYKDMLIMGSRVSEGSDAAPGHIRAYDVRTGKQKWIFHTIPHPGEYGFDSWKDSTAYKYIGGANAWAGFSLDEKRGMLFAPVGSASFDFYGGKRLGSNLFANCVLALNAETGKYIWHYQTIHHDLWDRDLPTAPSLVTIEKDGKEIDAVAQATKTGFVFLLDRETGKPLYPIEERPVPATSDLEGEEPWPTQPIPSFPKPFMRQSFTEADLNDLVPDSSYQDIRLNFQRSDHGNMFTPPSKRGSIFFPGLDGGAEWGGTAFDPASGLLYVNANEIPWQLVITEINLEVPPRESYLEGGQRLYGQYCQACHGADRKGSGSFPSLVEASKKYTPSKMVQLIATGRRMMPGFGHLTLAEKNAIVSLVLDLKSEQKKTLVSKQGKPHPFRSLRYSISGYRKFVSKEGYPAIKPPWGSLNAVNLNTGEIAWRIPFGEYPEFKKKGIITGTENYGGPIVTTGGLLFIAATRDGKFRAFNKKTGKVLWETELPAPGFATPSTYEVNGKQFIVIACGGGKLGTKSGDAYVAFALP